MAAFSAAALATVSRFIARNPSLNLKSEIIGKTLVIRRLHAHYGNLPVGCIEIDQRRNERFLAIPAEEGEGQTRHKRLVDALSELLHDVQA